AHRAFRASRVGVARSRHCKYRSRSHFDGTERSANGRCRFNSVSLSHLAISRRVRGYRACLIRLMAAQTDSKTPDVVVHGGADSFKQEITVGKHGLVADEPVSASGGDAGPDPYDYLL